MSCQKCDEMQAVAYYRVGKANVGLIGCDEHLNEVMRAVDGRKEDRPILRCFLPAPETTTPEAEGIEEKTSCELYDHVPALYDGAFWYCKVCNKELYFKTIESLEPHHHQLQKARQDWLREEIVRLEGIKTSFVPADSVWFGKDDYSEGEYKLVPSKDPSKAMYCLTCERFLPEEGCNCGTVELQTIIDRYQAELDQDKVCEVCHGHGNNGADDAQCLNCGGSGLDQDVSK